MEKKWWGRFLLEGLELDLLWSESEIVYSVMSISLQPHELYIAHQAPLSMEFSRQKHWSGKPFPFPTDLPEPGIKPRSAALQADSLLSEPPRKGASASDLPRQWNLPF